MHAIKNGFIDVASFLVQEGADPSAFDSSKNSVCHYAAGLLIAVDSFHLGSLWVA